MTSVAFTFAGMGIGEGDPDLVYLIWTEKMLDLVDAGTDEGYVCEAFFTGLRQATPHTGALDVDADIVDVTMRPGQSHGILSLAATQLKNDGVVVMEEVGAPTALQRKALGHDALIGILEQVVERLVLFEFL